MKLSLDYHKISPNTPLICSFDLCIVDQSNGRRVPEGSNRQKRMALQSQNLKQLTSKIKVKNLKRTALTDSPGRNHGDGAQVRNLGQVPRLP